MSKGVFYAVGVGVGNPMDITLNAKYILENTDVIVAPVKISGGESVAYNIAKQVVDMSKAKKIEIIFPMKSAIDYRANLRMGALKPVFNALSDGKIVAMVTLGDVSIYSTATYVRQVIEEQGYETNVIAGISSFCAGAAKLKYSLCENEESFIVIPAVKSKESVEKAIEQFDNIVIMKAGSAISWLIPMLEKHNLIKNTVMLKNIDMPDEYIGKPEIEHCLYFTTLLIKKGGLK